MILRVPDHRVTGLTAAVLVGSALAGVCVALGSIAAAAMLGVCVVVVLLAIPRAALPLLIVASALDRLGVHYKTSNIRLDLLVVVLLAIVAVNKVAVRSMRPAAWASPLVLPLLAYAGANLLSTLLFAQDRTRGLQLDVEICTAVLSYILASALIQRREDLDVALRTLWIVTTVEAVLGLGFAVAYTEHLWNYGVSEVASGFPAAYGTLWEPNVFGSFLMGNFLLLLADAMRHRRRGIYTIALVVIVAGIVDSLTRTVWIATAFGVIALLLYARRIRASSTLSPVTTIGGAAAVVGGLAAIFLTPVGARLGDLVNLHSHSAVGRIAWFRESVHEWIAAPVFGNGTGSWNFEAIVGRPHPWLPNLFLLTLHDTGIVGAAALVWVIWVFFRTTLAMIRSESDLAFLAVGAAVSFACLLIAFQTTTGFWFVYPWIVMVIGTSAARLGETDA